MVDFRSLLATAVLLAGVVGGVLGDDEQFVYSGFTGAALALDGTATITASGLLELTNGTAQLKGHAVHPSPLRFTRAPGGPVRSFSASFVFGIIPPYSDLSGHGIVFFVGKDSFAGALPSQYLGFLNSSNNGNASNHVFGVELDTIQSTEFKDPDNNHVGIDVNSLTSVSAAAAGYYDDGTGAFHNLTLISAKPMQVWVDYDGGAARIDVFLAPLRTPKPSRPLVSATQNLTEVLVEPAYVGFSSATGTVRSEHYVLGWSFAMDGPAPEINIAGLPRLPRFGPKPRSKVVDIVLPIATAASVLAVVAVVVTLVRRRLRYAELREDWELEFGPHRFTYKDLFRATEGFKSKMLLGVGGFGRVYRGVLPKSKLEVAVKKVSHESRQGIKEFVAEVVSIGRLRHRNLVQLLGYCRRKGELLLVYDYMPNGSLDKYLYGKEKDGDDDKGTAMATLDWVQRFRIIKGVASGLLYIHEDWEQVVIHRDIKASNVLLDSEMNGRLGDRSREAVRPRGRPADDPRRRHHGVPGAGAGEVGESVASHRRVRLRCVHPRGRLRPETRGAEHERQPADAGGLGAGALAERSPRRGDRREAQGDLRRGGGDAGAEAGAAVLAPAARGEAEHAAGDAVPRRRHAVPRAHAVAPQLQHAGTDEERRVRFVCAVGVLASVVVHGHEHRDHDWPLWREMTYSILTCAVSRWSLYIGWSHFVS